MRRTVNPLPQGYVGSNPTLPKSIYILLWALSLFGRAPRLHRGGERFESARVHFHVIYVTRSLSVLMYRLFVRSHSSMDRAIAF
jgi:hypothetical protein